MRVEFSQSVIPHLESDPASMFLTGDLGYMAFEKVKESLGKRFLNCGVAEQNMIGTAAGLALCGMKPWVYSIIPFLIFRPLEQIRNDIGFHNLPVRLVGNGGGYTYGIMGSTHHALEDLGVLKTLPNFTLYFPAIGEQVESAVKQISDLNGPSYLRLAVSAFPIKVSPLSQNPNTLTAHYLSGSECTIIAVGHALPLVLNSLKLAHGTSPSSIDADVFSVSKFPFDMNQDRALVESVLRTERVVVVDEHYADGGMGESLRRELPQVSKFGMINPYYSSRHRSGSSAFMLAQAHMTPNHIFERLVAFLAACQVDAPWIDPLLHATHPKENLRDHRLL